MGTQTINSKPVTSAKANILYWDRANESWTHVLASVV